MKEILVQFHTTSYGELLLGSFEDNLCLCDWRYRKMRARIDERLQRALGATMVTGTSQVINDTVIQLQEYFSYKRKTFDIELKMVGTEFQKKVWQQLMNIPYAHTASYMDLARGIGNTKAVRAVAGANGANAISIIVPCHRILGSDGSLVGYAGGLRAKKKLLKHEQNLYAQS